MSMKNEIMLITYPDSMGKNLQETAQLLTQYFTDSIGSVHILPFYPSSADRGFAPMTYREVDASFGSWEDIAAISRHFQLMFDFMINHISQSSAYFQDFLKHKDASPYADLFIRYNRFWPNGEPTEEDVDAIYKRKPRAPYAEAHFQDGTMEKVWCTFDEEQIDLNLDTPVTQQFIQDELLQLAKRGAAIIRLDAFAYAVKRPGTSCFFIEPDIWEMLNKAKHTLEPLGVEVLPEIHEHYSIQLKLAEQGHWVYDFALPMLVLHALYSGRSERLLHWLNICPRKQFTTLDTHDGIGIVDVRDLLTEQEIEDTKNNLFSQGANVKKIYNTTAYNNLDIYQINCTYYSALGNRDDAYLLARAIQFYAPGIPQVYYVGLLAGENDIALLEQTKTGRNINRHYYTREEVEQNLQRPVVQKLLELMKFRNTYPAFNGEIKLQPNPDDGHLDITWEKEQLRTTLTADLHTHQFTITYTDPSSGATKVLEGI